MKGGGGDGKWEKERKDGKERKRMRKGKGQEGEDDIVKEKEEVSPDVLEADTSSGWAQQALEQSRRENTRMNWRESNGDHCKEAEKVRSAQCTKMVKCLQ